MSGKWVGQIRGQDPSFSGDEGLGGMLRKQDE
jgi:hypothetical protein